MNKELKEFKDTAAQLNEQVNSFQSELREKQEKKRALERQYETMLSDDSSLAEINKVRQTIASLDSDIEILTNKIAKLESAKKSKVEPLLEAAKEAYERDLASTHEKLQPVFKEILDYRVKMLEALQRASADYQDIDAKYWDLHNEQVRAASDRARYNRLVRFDFNNVLYGQRDHAGRPTEPGLLPDKNEMMIAFFKGELPEWVQEFTDKQ
ncbi:hypothetical protein [Brevibacillus reuszeri]|uniref:hypothetical protein n=1 Tax=Brevibacillus reuszeri TaxID=54915 RepID=UPI000CCC5C1F|nr:hypothetical protein [Brevibacillus reuszeri]